MSGAGPRWSTGFFSHSLKRSTTLSRSFSQRSSPRRIIASGISGVSRGASLMKVVRRPMASPRSERICERSRSMRASSWAFRCARTASGSFGPRMAGVPGCSLSAFGGARGAASPSSAPSRIMLSADAWTLPSVASVFAAGAARGLHRREHDGGRESGQRGSSLHRMPRMQQEWSKLSAVSCPPRSLVRACRTQGADAVARR